MKSYYFLVLTLLLLLITPVAAAIVDTELSEWVDTSVNGVQNPKYGWGSASSFGGILFPDITRDNILSYIVFEIPGNFGTWKDSGEAISTGRHDFEYDFNGETRPGVLYLSRSTNLLGEITNTKFTIFLNEWDIGTLTGAQYLPLPFNIYTGPTDNYGSLPPNAYAYSPGNGKYIYPGYPITVTEVSGIPWINRIKIDELNKGYEINLDREVYKSTILVNKTNEIIHQSTLTGQNEQLWFSQTAIDLVTIISPSGQAYPFSLIHQPTVVQPVLRKGTVTMTDNNGTTITGFEVTAVNHYTGEEYTVATQSDVAVMTLPMERTITIRNPQTGVYEDAPVGYYKFYGQSPGYKMLNEDGIKVSVMPEIYGSYQLCDIRVRSESGYLTGNHQFQIRSRSDNSILQTGTISAKSATTNQWYNATVTGGIATIVLPYDTSNSISQYAGNYYVYATSPGYEDSEYATQIVVMPHTVSEIHDIYLTPIGGVPTAGNVTLRIQTFSETGPGVVNAEIFIAGVLGAGSDVWNTYIASSTGYLAVSVPGNSTYDIVASGAGFYDSSRRVTVFDDDPGLIEIKLYLSGAPTVEPTTQPTGWVTEPPTTQPTGGIPDEDDDSTGFLMQAVRGIGLAFGVGFATAKLIFGMLLALSIGYATAKQLRGGAAEFGLGLLGGTLLGVLIGLLPVWIIVVLLLVVGLYIGNRYVGGGNNG